MRAPLSYWLFRARSTATWYARAQTWPVVQSPYLREFLREVYHDRRNYHAFEKIAAVRKSWRGDQQEIALQNLGAQSRTTSKSARSAASLVASNAISDSSGRFLFRLTLWLRASRVLEFGTNAGISTLYLQEAIQPASVQTVEGNPAVAALARSTFDRAGVAPEAYVSKFDAWLAEHPPHPAAPYDLVFIDGDHRYQATLDYVTSLLPARHSKSVFVIADIHWSEGMQRAWEELKTLSEVTATVDTYHFGLLFFVPTERTEHLSLIPTRFKPWLLSARNGR